MLETSTAEVKVFHNTAVS
ncbi:hypothetical protein E2C01_102485 [Portunus trituberculatus]|uniref:Uncharacterized protein n=1 Tax=Portunus trituberculatus TaxID=210409 RepID=A0A5B7K8C9_PORTR|nr:hypothetical protein [Portunus trituberculatus]